MRYWQIMAVYQDAIDTNGADHPAVFAPFAGTEGYNPVFLAQMLGVIFRSENRREALI